MTLYADADLAAKLNALGDELRFCPVDLRGEKLPIMRRLRPTPGKVSC